MKKIVFGVVKPMTVFLSLVVTMPLSAAVDGTFSGDNTVTDESNASTWSSLRPNWDRNILPHDGGIAVYDATLYLTKMTSAVTLGGFRFLDGINSRPRFFRDADTDAGFVLAGDAEIYRKSHHTTAINNLLVGGVTFDVPVTAGAADATVTKTGGGAVRFSVPMTGFAKVTVKDGTLEGTMTSGYFLTDSLLEIAGGKVLFMPSLSSGESASVTLDALSLARGLDYLKVSKDSGDSATLSVGTLSVSEGALAVISSADPAELGVSEKIIVGEGAPAVTDGKCDGRFVVLDKSSSPYSLKWATYDATDGFKAVEPVYDGNNGTNSSNMAATAPVGAVMIAPAAFAEGVPSGSVDFGTKPGIVWFNPTGRRTFGLKDFAITGSGGVSFAGASDNATDDETTKWPVISNLDPRWTGDTHFYNCRAYMRSEYVPAFGHVWFHGDETYWGACCWPSGAEISTASQHFHFSGFGERRSNPGGIRYDLTSEAAFNGPVTFEGDTLILFSKSGTLAFKGAVNGPGSVSVQPKDSEVRPTLRLASEKSGSGRWTLSGGTRMYFDEGARFDSGALHLTDGEMLVDSATGVVSVAAAVTSENGAFKSCSSHFLRPNDVVFGGDASFGTFEFVNDAEIGVGSSLTVDATEGGIGFPVSVYPTSSSSKLILGGDGSSGKCGLRFVSGDAGTALELVKTGDGETSLVSSGNELDKLTVAQGTMKIGCPLLESADVAWWLDASAAETVFTDENGKVTNWVCRTGNGVNFTVPSGQTSPSYSSAADGINGKRVVSFTYDSTSRRERLACLDRRPTQKTVFFVMRPRKDLASGEYANVFGRYYETGFTREYGIRMLPSSTNIEAGAPNNEHNRVTYYDCTGGYFINGTKTRQYANNQTQILVATGPDDLFYSAQYGGGQWSTPRFRPEIGGYEDHTYGGIRGYNGDFAEIIAFNRALSETERKSVENYLQAKWMPDAGTLHAGVPSVYGLSASAFSAAPDVEVAMGAVLDLNGRDLSVNTLSGYGSVVNSGSPATLTVADGTGFAGSFGENVNVYSPVSASTTVSPVLKRPIEEGLNYWLDASAEDTVTTNAEGKVTAWASRDGSSGVTKFTGTAEGWSSSALRSKPAVYFTDGASQTLKADVNCLSKTIFLVWTNRLGTTVNAQVLGKDNTRENGWRFPGGGSARQLQITGTATTPVPTVAGDRIRFNRVETVIPHTTSTRLSLPTDLGDTYVMVIRLDNHQEYDTEPYSESWQLLGSAKDLLGKYSKSSAGMAVSELIAYNRPLSDAEVEAMEDYLYAKWITPAAIPEDIRQVVTVPTTFKLNPGSVLTLDGDQDLSLITLDATDMNAMGIVFKVTGTETGEFAGLFLPRGWKLVRNSEGYSLLKIGFSIVVR